MARRESGGRFRRLTGDEWCHGFSAEAILRDGSFVARTMSCFESSSDTYC